MIQVNCVNVAVYIYKSIYIGRERRESETLGGSHLALKEWSYFIMTVLIYLIIVCRHHTSSYILIFFDVLAFTCGLGDRGQCCSWASRLAGDGVPMGERRLRDLWWNGWSWWQEQAWGALCTLLQLGWEPLSRADEVAIRLVSLSPCCSLFLLARAWASLLVAQSSESSMTSSKLSATWSWWWSSWHWRCCGRSQGRGGATGDDGYWKGWTTSELAQEDANEVGGGSGGGPGSMTQDESMAIRSRR